MKTLKQILITAVVAALVSGVGVPYAKQHLINGKQIKKGTVTGKQVKFPKARAIAGASAASARAHASVADQFTAVAAVGTYTKQDAQAVLRVDWTGAVGAGVSPCLFQLRINGQPGQGGEMYVTGGREWQNTSALFSDLPAGDYRVEIWARLTQFAGQDYPCTVDPSSDAPRPTAVATEEVR